MRNDVPGLFVIQDTISENARNVVPHQSVEAPGINISLLRTTRIVFSFPDRH